jgi:hypothetical protein
MSRRDSRVLDREGDDKEDVQYLDYDIEEKQGRVLINTSNDIDNADLSETRRRLSIGNKPKFSLKQGVINHASFNTDLMEESNDININSISVNNENSHEDEIDFNLSTYASEVRT